MNYKEILKNSASGNVAIFEGLDKSFHRYAKSLTEAIGMCLEMQSEELRVSGAAISFSAYDGRKWYLIRSK